MKTQTLLTLAIAALISLSAGCKTTPPRVTKLPDATTGEVTKVRDLSDGNALTTAGAGSVTGLDSSLSNEDKLLGRDFDRATFANQTVYFEFDHSNVKADEASKIDQVAAAFKAKGREYDLLIEGHCDERGTEEYNRSLGERRALAIRELLMKSGVEAGQVFTRTYGKDKPAATGHDESAWSKNRRGEFVLVLPKKITTTQNTQ